MKFSRKRNLFNWHKKSQIDFLPAHWAWSLFVGGLVLGIIYFFVALGSLRFFIGNYFQIAGINKDYLIVLQNQYELRPTGGFVSAYGVLKFRFFLPVGFEIKDSFVVGGHEYVEPPEILGKLLADPWYEGHTFRDANWNPDFKQTAESLQEFYQKVFPEEKFAGVIAVNFSVVEKLVKAFQKINLQGEKILPQDLFYLLEYETKNIDKHNEQELGERKGPLQTLGKALVTRSFWHLPTVAQILQASLQEKEIQFWFKNEDLEEQIQAKNWAGEFMAKDFKDNLGVVFANLGGKKADRYLTRSVDYVVDFLPDQNPLAHVVITLTHHGDHSLVSDRFKGYFRLYFPKNSVLETQVDSFEENNFQVIGQEILLNPGETVRFNFNYRLPADVFVGSQYFLSLFKQSGVEVDYSLVLKVPGDLRFESEILDVRENRAFFAQKLKQDQDFVVKIIPDKIAPIIYDQKFDALDQIAIFVNEKLDRLNVADVNNYRIEDLNVINSIIDEVQIKKVEYDGDKTIHLFLEGVTDQPLERYRITLQNIQDEAGNILLPLPKEITVVQRFDK